MKANSKWISAVAVLALGASLAVAAPQEGGFGRGEGHGRGRGHGRQEFGAKFAEKLNLSDAQKQQIKDIKQNFRAQNKAFFDSVKQTHQDLRAAKEANDTAKVEALKPTLDAQRAQMKQLRETEKNAVLAILTPDQRAQYDAMKAERAAKWQARRNAQGQSNQQ
jgi:Spy/CpxP family protein refolding chaperone